VIAALLAALLAVALGLLGLNVALALAYNDQKRARLADARIAYVIGHYDGAQCEAMAQSRIYEHGELEVPVGVWPLGLDDEWSKTQRITPERVASGLAYHRLVPGDA
jgi:hypothetical protein